MTLADVLRPAQVQGRSALLYQGALVMGGSLFVALCAQIAVFLPFTPVPVTGQTMGVLLTGALLGSRRGALSLLLYLAEGIAGLPVFSAGRFGLAFLLGTSGGYLVGFIAAAALVGWLAERGWDRRPWSTAGAMLIGNMAIYAFALPWLARFMAADAVLVGGLYPFIPGDLIKIALAMVALPSGWRLLGQTGAARPR